MFYRSGNTVFIHSTYSAEVKAWRVAIAELVRMRRPLFRDVDMIFPYEVRNL